MILCRCTSEKRGKKCILLGRLCKPNTCIRVKDLPAVILAEAADGS